ncbi:unnamed protein product, partial [Gulo gulo]
IDDGLPRATKSQRGARIYFTFCDIQDSASSKMNKHHVENHEELAVVREA